MYISESERTVLCKICYVGPSNVGKGEMLHALRDHFAARDGAGTHIEQKRFTPRSELSQTMKQAEVDQFVANAEAAFGASYADLTLAGTLIWMRAALPGSSHASTYRRSAEVFCASGVATNTALSDWCLAGADAVVFVADGRAEGLDATKRSWDALKGSFRGPIVLLANHVAYADEIAEELEFEGQMFAEPGEFAGTLEAFHAVAAAAMRKFKQVN